MEAKFRWLLIAAIAPIAWGSTYFVTKHFLPVDAPLWGAFIRALPAGLVLLLIARKLPHGSWWWKSLVLGTLNVGAFFVLVYVASTLLPSSVAATIMAAAAGVLMLVAWPLLGERPAARSLLGAALGLIGVTVLVFDGGGSVNPLGVVASLAAMLMSAFGFALTKRWSSEESVIAVTSWQLLGGALIIAPFAIVIEGAPPALDASAFLGFAYVTLIATALAYVAWFAGLKHLPASSVGLVGLLNPISGVLLGTLLGGEDFGLRQAAGTVIVLIGVLVGQKRK
ncbi:EamA family transporter [Leucobacter sp. UT-8R-CII-1-4]|uniref:DMT family transporter n=1 Tax=Leucobacter sp. UT-8R-CII-1-4 TaxID=3040075 RepID=UPI0024A9BD9C|nr:EamA family transporter [Leucobacter sp. UT-8R-CII-1-4]MDI6022522.1 EamA family transporter [Leucobacter sp. UT-8R-CII-1-4]